MKQVRKMIALIKKTQEIVKVIAIRGREVHYFVKVYKGTIVKTKATYLENIL